MESKYGMAGVGLFGLIGFSGVVYALARLRTAQSEMAMPMTEPPQAIRYGAYVPEPERPYYEPMELAPPSRMTPVPPALRYGAP